MMTRLEPERIKRFVRLAIAMFAPPVAPPITAKVK
jgi:hypothetical protein